MTDGQQIEQSSPQSHIGHDEDDDVAAMRVKASAVGIVHHEHRHQSQQQGRRLDGVAQPGGPPLGQAHEHGEHGRKTPQRHEPVVPRLLSTAGDVGIKVLHENRKIGEQHRPPYNLSGQTQPRHATFAPLADAERESRPHGKEESREHKVDPGDPGDSGIVGMGGGWLLAVVHPSGQDTAHHGCAENHCDDGIATQGIEGKRTFHCSGLSR